MTEVTYNLYRGPRPVDWNLLKQYGIKNVLSLETGWFEFLHGRMYREDQDAQKAGMNMLHYPLSNLWAPSYEDVISCLIILRSSFPTYVHCEHGVDRTGFIIAAYRVRLQGWDVDQAVEEWKKLGFNSWFYFWWEHSFRKMMKEFS